jgi:hypothetical protein
MRFEPAQDTLVESDMNRLLGFRNSDFDCALPTRGQKTALFVSESLHTGEELRSSQQVESMLEQISRPFILIPLEKARRLA